MIAKYRLGYRLTELMRIIMPTILEDADAAVSGPRAMAYGRPEENLTRIAALWQYYLGVPINAQDVCMLMVLLKVGRAATGEPNRDNLVDIAGYARCCEMIQTARPRPIEE